MGEVRSRENDQIAATIASFLPRRVTGRLLEYGGTAAVPSGKWTEGAFMFADISGFTVLSEKLAQAGKIGAEEITRIINQFMDRMLVLVDRYGGDVIKFGGDALFILFEGFQAADRTLKCGRRMMAAITEMSTLQSEYGTFVFGMSMGLAFGTVFESYLGSPTRIEHLMTGLVINDLVAAESCACRGEICGTSAFEQQLESAGASGRKDQFLLYHVDNAANLETPEWEREQTVLPDLAKPFFTSAAGPYFPSGVLDKIFTNPWQDRMEGEHRLSTVLFANYLGFETLLEQQPGPSALEQMQLCFTALLREIETYGGTMNKVDISDHGAKMLVLFGVPQTHENDAERGLLCALAMQQAARQLRERGLEFNIRIGVNTGFLFSGNVGSALRREYSVMGDAVNLAARLMGAAHFDHILADAGTAAKAVRTVKTLLQSPIHVKGKEAAIPLVEVLEQREQLQHRTHMLYGRRAEKLMLDQVLLKVSRAGRQLVALKGEAGVGKSALLSYFIDQARARNWRIALGECPSYGQNMLYHSLGIICRQLLGCEHQAHKDRIFARLTEIIPGKADYFSLLGSVLGLDWPESAEVQHLDPESRHRIVLSLLATLIRHIARDCPLVMIFEDAHWIDESSREFIDYLTLETSSDQIVLMVVHRPDFKVPSWRDNPDVTVIELERIDDEALAGMVGRLLGERPPSPELLRFIMTKTQGNAMFIEEFVTMLREKSVLHEDEGQLQLAPAATMDLPDSIHGVVMTRIDRLGEKARQFLQRASVLGRIFAAEVFHDYYGEVGPEMEQAQTSDILMREFQGGEEFILFKHILVQEVIYDSVLFQKRQTLHYQAGEVIERLYDQDTGSQAEILAHHFVRAEAWERSLPYLKTAGEKAKKVYSNQTALYYYDLYREVLQGKLTSLLSEHPRIRQDLYQVYLDSGEIQRYTYQPSDAVARYEEMAALSTRFQDRKYQILAGNYQAEALTGQGLLDQSISVLERSLVIASELGDVMLQARLHYQFGMVELWRQHYARASDFFQNVLTWTRGTTEKRLYCSALFHLANIKMDQGETGVDELYQETERIARELHDHVLLVSILSNRGTLASKQGDFQTALQRLDTARVMAENIQSQRVAIHCRLNIGTILFDQGDMPTAQEQSITALAKAEKIGDKSLQALALLNLGRVALENNDSEAAWTYLQRSRTLAEQVSDRFTVAQDLILLGYLTFIRSGRGEAGQNIITEGLTLGLELGMTDISALGKFYLALTLTDADPRQSDALLKEIECKAAQEGDIFLLRKIAEQKKISRKEVDI